MNIDKISQLSGHSTDLINMLLDAGCIGGYLVCAAVHNLKPAYLFDIKTFVKRHVFRNIFMSLTFLPNYITTEYYTRDGVNINEVLIIFSAGLPVRLIMIHDNKDIKNRLNLNYMMYLLVKFRGSLHVLKNQNVEKACKDMIVHTYMYFNESDFKYARLRGFFVPFIPSVDKDPVKIQEFFGIEYVPYTKANIIHEKKITDVFVSHIGIDGVKCFSYFLDTHIYDIIFSSIKLDMDDSVRHMVERYDERGIKCCSPMLVHETKK